MDKEGEQHPNMEKQGSSSSASTPIDELTDNARKQKTKQLAGQTQPREKHSGSESGDKPQHSMSKRGGDTGNVNDPKEGVGGPNQPGKPPERTPDHPRDSASKL